MSLYRWFRSTSGSSTSQDASFSAAAEAVEAVEKESISIARRGKKRKSSERHHYDDETRTTIGKHAIKYGNKSTVEKYSRSLGFDLPEATVRNFKRELEKQIRSGKRYDEVRISVQKRGRHLLLPEEMDSLLSKFIQSLRLAGSPVSSSIIIAAARGIVVHKDQSLLKEYGGPIELQKSWAFSFLRRYGYVKRKGTRTARKLPDDFEMVKAAFLERVADIVKTHKISPSMIVNFDQTGAKIIPVNEWSLEVKGSKQVDIVALDDKREITVLLAVSLSGKVLPPQVIYAGKTTRCHPSVSIPDGWHVTHSDNHWSTETTMLEYIEKVLVPYMSEQRRFLNLESEAPALCIFDVFAAHRCKSFLEKLEACSIKHAFVPAGCTGQLQPLDVSINDPFKKHQKELFSSWYADKVKESLDKDVAMESVKIDLRTSTIKPVHFQWLTKNMAWLSHQDEVLIRGWKETGILDCISSNTPQ